ncbi:MAG TPA: caspase family protein [Longimicrobium sp.]
MPRAMSIHIGINDDGRRVVLNDSETAAWQMAGLAWQAGYGSILVLRGQEATRGAVHAALAGASQALREGDSLFVSFSGHGGQEPDHDGDDGGFDESWCLYDGPLLDDKLAGYWRLFDAGVRIVVVSESCFAGGLGRTGHGHAPGPVSPDAPRRMRGGLSYRDEPSWAKAAVAKVMASCVVEPPQDSREIRASVLMLTASAEHQPARGGLFTRCLLEAWGKDGFDGSYCALYKDVRQRVMNANPRQEPHVLMLGTPDPDFLELPAFRLDRTPGPPRDKTIYRGPVHLTNDREASREV